VSKTVGGHQPTLTFHRAYLHATQQAFLEAHEHAFAYFGGVFRLLRYDNLASVVRKILRGYRREETVRFMRRLRFSGQWDKLRADRSKEA